MKPIRIQRKRVKGFKLPPNTVSVTRPGKWGNPFKVGSYLNAWGKAFVAIELGVTPEGVHKIYDSGLLDEKVSLENSIKWHRLWIQFHLKNNKSYLDELRGKNLACFCKLSDECHADTLLKLSNQ